MKKGPYELHTLITFCNKASWLGEHHMSDNLMLWLHGLHMAFDAAKGEPLNPKIKPFDL